MLTKTGHLYRAACLRMEDCRAFQGHACSPEENAVQHKIIKDSSTNKAVMQACTYINEHS